MQNQNPTRIAVILGTRPEYLKLAPVVAELARHKDRAATDVIFTGQHRELLAGLPELFDLGPSIQLPVHNTTPNLPGLTAALVAALDGQYTQQRYDAVIVQGDTTTAFCAALGAFYHRTPVAHVEAGLRTGNLDEPFPEELNRQLISRIAQWHFVPTAEAGGNLLRESVAPERIVQTGNTIIDTLQWVRTEKTPPHYEAELLPVEAPELAAALANVRAAGARTLALLTIHRRENHGEKLGEFFQMVRKLAADFPDHHVIYPYHLNPEVKTRAFAQLNDLPNVHLVPPLSYRPFLYLMGQADFALSDSGGLQEEFPSFAKPLLVLRDVTERPELIEARLGKLIGIDPQAVYAATAELIKLTRAQQVPTWYVPGPNPFGDGRASERIVRRILDDVDAARR